MNAENVQESETGPKILVIDDSALIRRQLRECLGNAGYDVMEQPNGAEGLQAATVHQPDLIIVDLHMPVMNGLDMLEGLKKAELAAPIPAIVLTTESTSSVIARGREAGALAWIIKPFREVILLKAIKHILSTSRTQASGS